MPDDNMSPPPVYDITQQILLAIRDELRGIREDLRDVNMRVDNLTTQVETGFERLDHGIDQTNTRLDILSNRVETGFAMVDRRFDAVLTIAGTHHVELEARVRRIEDHLGIH